MEINMAMKNAIVGHTPNSVLPLSAVNVKRPM